MGATVGAAFNSFEMALDKNQKVTLALWDTAGAERFESMIRTYYKDAEAAILCYDVTDIASWNKVKFWAQEVQAVEEKCVMAIVGTKADLLETGERSRAVPLSQVKKFAAGIGARVFETSAKLGDELKHGDKIIDPFAHVAREVLKKRAVSPPPPPPTNTVRLDQPPSRTSNQEPCCK